MTHAPDVLGAGFASTFSVAKYLAVVGAAALLLIALDELYRWLRWSYPWEPKVQLTPACPKCGEELIGAKRPRLCGQCADHQIAA